MPKLKNILIFTAIAVVFILIYIFFLKPAPDQASLVSTPTGAILPNMDGSMPATGTANANSLVTSDFLTLLSSVKTIKLDAAIFADPAFNSLHDSSIILVPDGTEGRPNPFAQFGVDITPTPPATPVSSLPANTTSPTTPVTPTAGAPVKS